MAFLLAGLATGIIGGLFGVGGGEIFIPLLIYLFGFTQHQAQGTSLAVLLPPIGLLAAMRYYQAGHVNSKVAGGQTKPRARTSPNLEAFVQKLSERLRDVGSVVVGVALGMAKDRRHSEPP